MTLALYFVPLLRSQFRFICVSSGLFSGVNIDEWKGRVDIEIMHDTSAGGHHLDVIGLSGYDDLRAAIKQT